MLKRNITYTDFNDRQVTETFYFNLSKPELMELELGSGTSLSQYVTNIIAAENFAGLLAEFKKLILLAYGEKSEDGKRFIKNEKLREEFASSAAFIALYMELCTNEQQAALFFNGIMPSDMTVEVAPVIPTTVAPPTDFEKMQQAAHHHAVLPPPPSPHSA